MSKTLLRGLPANRDASATQAPHAPARCSNSPPSWPPPRSIRPSPTNRGCRVSYGGAADDDGARRRHRHGPVSGQRSLGERRRAGVSFRTSSWPASRSCSAARSPRWPWRIRPRAPSVSTPAVRLAVRRLRRARQLLADGGDRNRRSAGRRLDLHGYWFPAVPGAVWVFAFAVRCLRQLVGRRHAGRARVLARHDQAGGDRDFRRAGGAGRPRAARRTGHRPRATPGTADSCHSACPASGSPAAS